jgi:hypothetical protein
VLLAFEKAGDALISEHALEGARIEDVRALTGQPPTNPMHDSYPVSEAQAPWLEARTGHKLDFFRHEYFVEGVFD